MRSAQVSSIRQASRSQLKAHPQKGSGIHNQGGGEIKHFIKHFIKHVTVDYYIGISQVILEN